MIPSLDELVNEPILRQHRIRGIDSAGIAVGSGIGHATHPGTDSDPVAVLLTLGSRCNSRDEARQKSLSRARLVS